MIEKRSQPRYLPRQPIPVVLQVGGKLVQGQLGDISARGCLLLLPLVERPRYSQARTLMGEIDISQCDGHWEGEVTHHSAVRCHHGMGVRFAQSKSEIIEKLLASDGAGGLRVRSWQDTTQAEIIGHLGFHMNRQFLALVRQGRLTRVDLSACTGVDSAGIGLLAIARDKAIEIGGARGSIRELLSLANLVDRKEQHPTWH